MFNEMFHGIHSQTFGQIKTTRKKILIEQMNQQYKPKLMGDSTISKLPEKNSYRTNEPTI
jgi:hypothetical protein